MNFCRDCRHKRTEFMNPARYWHCHAHPTKTYKIYGPTGRHNVVLSYAYCDQINPCGYCSEWEPRPRRWWAFWRWFR